MRNVTPMFTLGLALSVVACGAPEQTVAEATEASIDSTQQELVGSFYATYRFRNNATGRCLQANGGLGSCTSAAAFQVYMNGGFYDVCNSSSCLNLQARVPYFWVGFGSQGSPGQWSYSSGVIRSRIISSYVWDDVGSSVVVLTTAVSGKPSQKWTAY